MNIIRQFLAFDDYLLYNQKLSSGQIALWRALVSINNKAGWADWFTAANATLETLSGLSRSGINKNRNSLKQLGLIDFRSNGKKATSYHVTRLYTSDSTQGSTQEKALSSNSVQQSTQQSVQGSVQQSTQQSAHNSSTLNKQKEKQKEKEKETTTYVFKIFKILETNGFGNPYSEPIKGDIEFWFKKLTDLGYSDAQIDEWLICGVQIAIRQNKRFWNYVLGTLRQWDNKALYTKDAIKGEQAIRDERKSYNSYQQPPQKREDVPDWQSLAGPIESDPQRKAEIDRMMKEYFDDQDNDS